MSTTFGEPQSRNEAILQNMLGASNELGEPQSRIEYLLMELLDAWQNLDPGGGGGESYAVKYVAQTLSDSQQTQARANISAASDSDVLPATTSASAGDFLRLDANKDAAWETVPIWSGGNY